jgi:hypothetical protein
VQAGGDRAARVAGVQGADQITGPHRPALGHRRRHRLVRGAQAAGVVDADHPAAGHLTREPDHARPGRVHGSARIGGQIDTAVAGQPGPRRRIEPAHHGRVPVQRPAKARTPADRATKAGILRDRPVKADDRHAKTRRAGCGRDQ